MAHAPEPARGQLAAPPGAVTHRARTGGHRPRLGAIGVHAWQRLPVPGWLWSGLVSGALFWLSIPACEWYLAAWVCLVPGLVRLRGCTGRQAWWAGLAGGVLAGIGRTYWIAYTLERYGDLAKPTAVVTTALLIVYLATYWGAFFWLLTRFDSRRPLFPWAVASAWVLLEWVQSWMISGFPWQLLGYSQYRVLPVAQVAAAGGIFALSFLIALINGGAAQALLWRHDRRRLATAAGVPLIVLAATYATGQTRLTRLEAEAGPELTVGVLQGNVSQDEKWKAGRKAGSTLLYASLARQLAPHRPDLVVYPETAMPFFFTDSINAEHRAVVRDLARELGAPLLVGSLGGSWEEGIYNRAWLIDAQGEVAGSADKVHLVPFGEYIPLIEVFRYLSGLTAESGAFAPGHSHPVLRLPGPQTPFGVFICYESIFPEISRELADGGAEVLINTTNDAWFGQTAAPYQHFAMVVLRAIETGRPVVRAANTGISGLVAPTGRIVHATPLFTREAFTVRVRPRTEPTFYTRWGNAIVPLSGLLLAVAALDRWRSRRATTPA